MGDPDSRRNSRDRVLPETAVAKERPTCLKRNHVVLLEATWCCLGHHQGLVVRPPLSERLITRLLKACEAKPERRDLDRVLSCDGLQAPRAGSLHRLFTTGIPSTAGKSQRIPERRNSSQPGRTRSLNPERSKPSEPILVWSVWMSQNRHLFARPGGMEITSSFTLDSS